MASRTPAAFRIAVVAGVVLLALALAGGKSPLGGAAFQLLWFLVIFVVVIPAHELGHALAGALLGFEIRSVVIGVGPALLAFKMAGVPVRLNMLPLAGVTMGSPRRKSWVRLRMWIFTAGGPGANLIFYFVLHRLYGHGASLAVGEHSFASVAAAANWAVFTLNVIPFRTAEGAASDGYSLLTVPFWGRRRIEDAQVAAEGSTLAEALRRDDLETAARLSAELRARYPDHPLSLLWAGSLLHRQGRHEEARTLWRQTLAIETEPARIAIIKNDIAFADALIADEAGLREADLLSEAALIARPDHPSVSGTRGTVLVRLGRPAEALPLLRRAAGAHQPDGRAEAYNRAALASALAMLGRAAEARHELDQARRANPRCDLLDQAEADLRTAAAAGVVPAAASQPESIARALGRWGGVVRWQQLARGLAFVSLVAPPNVVSTTTFPLFLTAMAILLSPEPTGLAVLGACGAWVAVLRILSRAGYEIDAAAPGWQVVLGLGLALAATGLAVVRRHLGPQPPSKAPVYLGWFFGILGVPAILAVALRLAQAPLALRSNPRDTLTHLGLALNGTVVLVAFGTVLLLGRRRWVKLLAIVPAALVISAVVGARDAHVTRARAEAVIDAIPIDGASIVWSDPRPATVLRARQVSAPGYLATLSPGGRAFFVPDLRASLGKTPRSILDVGDFEGRLVEIEGTAAAFVDDERLIVVRGSQTPDGSPEIAEVRPAAGPAPVWTRSIPGLEISAIAVDISIDPDGRTIVLTGIDREGNQQVLVRTGLERDAPVENVQLTSRFPEADASVATFSTPTGAYGLLVSRVRVAGGPLAYLPGDDHEGDETDLELWSLSSKRETLVAAHAPDVTCPHPQLGRPDLWCVARGGAGQLLLRIDPVAGRTTRLRDALPPELRITSIGPSRFALAADGKIGVLDLGAGRGTWLTLPSAASSDRARPQLAHGALATFFRPALDKDATLTVYALP